MDQRVQIDKPGRDAHCNLALRLGYVNRRGMHSPNEFSRNLIDRRNNSHDNG
jgi:hypothetical protein